MLSNNKELDRREGVFVVVALNVRQTPSMRGEDCHICELRRIRDHCLLTCFSFRVWLEQS